VKPRPRLTEDNNPLNRRPTTGGDHLTPPVTPPATAAWVSYQIPPHLQQELHALHQQWQAQMPELTESQLVEWALQLFLARSRKAPPSLPLPTVEEDVMGYLD